MKTIRTRLSICALLAAMFAPALAAAFNGHVVTEGPLTLAIGAVETVTAFDTPRDVNVYVGNAVGGAPLSVQLKLTGLVDEWRAIGPAERTVQVAGGTSASAVFKIAAGKGAVSALYPVHVVATARAEGNEVSAHAIQVFETDFGAPPAAPAIAVDRSGEPPLNVVPAAGALALAALKTQRVSWAFYDQPLVHMPIGWQGTDARSAATFSRAKVTRGAAKSAITMHPPYRTGGGSIFAEYRVKLPATKPLRLTFANAIRDSNPTEPLSDGVTFRVWAGEEQLFERHTDSKVWVEGGVDLDKFAGREILLRLESNPGPKRNTVCDSSHWGEPVITAGAPAAPMTDGERKALATRAAKLVGGLENPPSVTGGDAFRFDLAGGHAAAIVLGKHGLADAAIAFGKGDKSVVFDGLSMSVLDREFGRGPSQIAFQGAQATRGANGRVTVAHRLVMGEEQFDLTAEAWADGDGLRLKVACPQRITDLALGPADCVAPRVYYGHGYCVVDPEPFKQNFGGHNLATSHVGFEFDNGVALLTASDNPPDLLEVDPAQRLYALRTHHDATLTFVPSLQGAFDCAIRYRPLYDKQPAPAVPRKAGRFVFDIWGARYAEIADTMERAFAYGLTDALLLIHTWQRWGYDYRLPDIYPPMPSLGTLDDMRRIGAVCAKRDVPWGLHDNYIDFYPDATDYSYDRICFTEDGRPVKAWINYTRDAQSYRWRPDKFMPFLERNLELMAPDLKPTASFVDVFTAARPFDYYDRDGQFHSALETRKYWGEAFDTIRNRLGGNAPTSSEAGGDQLIGHLDGADCQHLQLTPKAAFHETMLRCGDWERTPWFDAVNHARFILHGAGYSVRYQGSRSREEHGIESDDYLSDEILLGHALMIDRGAWGRGAVRKYWLAQDFARGVALDEIVNVEYPGGDIHRQIVSWKSGARAWVNRGKADWTVGGRALPMYGYLARAGGVESSIERIGGAIVEQSRGPSRFYVNARAPKSDAAPLPIRPAADKIEYLGGRQFRLTLAWDAQAPTPGDLNVFVHFNRPQLNRKDKPMFVSGETPKSPTSQWRGAVRTGAERVVEIPGDFGAGEYEILAGLLDPKTKQRVRLLGDDFGDTRYRVGVLIVEGRKDEITGVRLAPAPPKKRAESRVNDRRIAIDFGPAVTTGAFRCEARDGGLVVTPLPDGEAFDLALRLDKAGARPGAKARSVAAVAIDGAKLRDVEFQLEGAALKFATRADEFAYRVELE